MRNIGQFSRHASQAWMARQTLGYSDRCPLYSRKRTSLKWAVRSLLEVTPKSEVSYAQLRRDYRWHRTIRTGLGTATGGCIDGEFTTTGDVAEAALFFASAKTNALTGQSLIISHGWFME